MFIFFNSLFSTNPAANETEGGMPDVWHTLEGEDDVGGGKK